MMEPAPGIIWAAIPIELVTEGFGEPFPAPVEVTVEGRLVQVLPGSGGLGSVCRLISGNPQDYLDSRWQPGAQIRLHQGE